VKHKRLRHPERLDRHHYPAPNIAALVVSLQLKLGNHPASLTNG
jgi:hypothetical protein